MKSCVGSTYVGGNGGFTPRHARLMAMATHVSGYTDEWRATLSDPEKLRRFSSFVNAPDQPDPSLAYVVERGQPRPATAAERDQDQNRESGAVLISGPRLEVNSR